MELLKVFASKTSFEVDVIMIIFTFNPVYDLKKINMMED